MSSEENHLAEKGESTGFFLFSQMNSFWFTNIFIVRPQTTGWVICTTIKENSLLIHEHRSLFGKNVGNSSVMSVAAFWLRAAESGHSYYSELNIGWETDGERHL